MPDDDWDMAEEVAVRHIHTAQDMQDYSSSIPYPRFTPKGCQDGAHHMHPVAGFWQCFHCQARRPIDGRML